MSAPKEVWVLAWTKEAKLLTASTSENGGDRYLLASDAEAETASLRAQLAEATKQAETDRQHALRLFRDLHATSEERDALRSQLAEAMAERDEERNARLRDESEHLGVRHELVEVSAALAVAEGERLTLAHGYRELALSAGDLNEDEEVLMALAERIVAEERTKEGSENG